MSSSETSNYLEKCDRQRCVGFGNRGRSLLDFTDPSTPLDLAGDENLASALRRREDAFNEDVLPPDAKLTAPREFYAAAVMACLPRGGGRRRASQSPAVTRRCLFFM